LEKLGFRREFLREFRVVVEKTRALPNFELLETMHDREEARLGYPLAQKRFALAERSAVIAQFDVARDRFRRHPPRAHFVVEN